MSLNSTFRPKRSARPGRRMLSASVALLAAASVAAPSAAEDPDPNAATVAATAAVKAQTDLINAKTAQTQAETARLQAQFAGLGLNQAKGETTLGDKAGQMEAAILSASAMTMAAQNISTAIGGTGKVIVVGPTDTVDLGLPTALAAEMDTVTLQARTLVSQACPATGGGMKSLISPLDIAGLVISALKVDTTVTGLEVTLADSNRALVNAVAGQLAGRAIVPSEAVLPADFSNTPIGMSWAALRAVREKIVECRARLGGTKPEVAAALTAGLTGIDSFASGVTKTENGSSLLIRASQLQAIGSQGAQVLRVAAEYTGGTMVQRKHIGTMFGSTGVKLTGGLIASYRLTDPTSGGVVKAGVLSCPTGLVKMGKVHKGEVRLGRCASLVGIAGS
jgi:hypothetical protein